MFIGNNYSVIITYFLSNHILFHYENIIRLILTHLLVFSKEHQKGSQKLPSFYFKFLIYNIFYNNIF